MQIFYDNIYTQYIDYLKKKTKNKNLDLEKHHIIPLHDKGEKSGEIVLCTSQQHTLAHYYRFLAYGQKGDLIAFTMR